jgi:general secretion pathway protein G
VLVGRVANLEDMDMDWRGGGWTGSRGRRRGGFTLIELLVVIVVLGVLATLVAPNIFRHVGTAKETTARAQIEMLGAALDAYRLDTGRYPTTEQGLAALWQEPAVEPRPTSWRGPYLRKTVPLDPWGNAYVYQAPGTARGTVLRR